MADQRARDDNAYVFDHFFCKLLTLSATLHTPEARKLAQRRQQIMEEYAKAFAEEVLCTRAENCMV